MARIRPHKMMKAFIGVSFVQLFKLEKKINETLAFSPSNMHHVCE